MTAYRDAVSNGAIAMYNLFDTVASNEPKVSQALVEYQFGIGENSSNAAKFLGDIIPHIKTVGSRR